MKLEVLRIKDYFQQKAYSFDSVYDETNQWTYWLNRIFRRGIFDRLQLTLEAFKEMENYSVLDVGCGSGRTSIEFAHAGAKQVVGIDVSSTMIELAVEQSRRYEVGKACQFIQGDFFEYAPDLKFDAVVALGVFDYISNPDVLLKKMFEHATQKVIASFPNAWSFRSPFRKLRYQLKNCPVYFYTMNQLHLMCKGLKFKKYHLEPYDSGLFLVGEVN